MAILLHCRLTNLGSGLGHQILDESKYQVSSVIGSGQGGVPGSQGCDVSNFVPVKLTGETVSCTFPLSCNLIVFAWINASGERAKKRYHLLHTVNVVCDISGA